VQYTSRTAQLIIPSSPSAMELASSSTMTEARLERLSSSTQHQSVDHDIIFVRALQDHKAAVERVARAALLRRHERRLSAGSTLT
jgi:hypothetical protein